MSKSSVKELFKSIHTKRERIMALKMRTPPIVGVSFFFLCSSASKGQSSTRIDCPVFSSYNFLMQKGPTKMVKRSAVSAARIIRVEEYTKAEGIFHPHVEVK